MLCLPFELSKMEERKDLEDSLRDEMAQVIDLFKYSLINYLMGFFSGLFLNQAVKCYHSQQILLIINAKLLFVVLQLSFMSFPAARTRSSSWRFTFIGYSRSAILIFIESSSIKISTNSLLT